MTGLNVYKGSMILLLKHVDGLIMYGLLNFHDALFFNVLVN